MSIIGFICPDGETTTFKRCLDTCRMSERCMSVATLKMMSDQRPKERPPSTTELLSGTCEAYLKELKTIMLTHKILRLQSWEQFITCI